MPHDFASSPLSSPDILIATAVTVSTFFDMYAKLCS